MAVIVALSLLVAACASSKEASGPPEALAACAAAVDAFKATYDASGLDDSKGSAQYDAAALRSLRACGPENGISNGESAWIEAATRDGYLSARDSGGAVLDRLCERSDPARTTALCRG
jgi:hypothetical protein